MKSDLPLFSPDWAERAITAALNDHRVKKTKRRLHMSPAVFREHMELAFSNGCYLGESVFWNAMDAGAKRFNQEKQAWRTKLNKRIENDAKPDIRRKQR